MRIGIVAPASPVGQVELANGLARLRDEGLDVVVHPQCADQHFIFAGTDEQRAKAFYEFATDNRIDVIWAAGGGYGVTRMLPVLEELAEASGTPPRKLLVGYSDITALHDFVRSRWGWSSLHCPMPSASNFPELDAGHVAAAVSYVNRRKPADPWAGEPVRFIANAPTQPVHGVLVGGNLSLWAATTGTPFAPIAAPGRIIFLEDVGEAPYRIDRMVVQLLQAGAFFGTAAIVLGDFTNCEDDPNMVRASHENAEEKKPLRPKIALNDALVETFGRLGERLGVPVAVGLPVGHGPNFAPLPLGGEYELTPDGKVSLQRWNWLRAPMSESM